MSNEVQVEGKESLPEVVSIPKKVRPTRQAYLNARLDYETGNYSSMEQLASKYGLEVVYLRKKASVEKWKPLKAVISNKISQIVEKRAESKVDSFFECLEKKGIYYEKLVEASQSQASRNSEGIPELEPVDLEKYARVEGIAIEWRKTALGITDKVSVSGSVDINVNIVNILEKIRERMRPGVTVDVEAVKEELKGCELIDG